MRKTLVSMVAAGLLPGLAAGFELAQIIDAPMTLELTAAADGERIAWVTYEAGKRNVWTASGPAFEPRQLTGFDRDSGQRVGGLVLASGGELLFYEHGNAEGANPASLPDPPVQTIRVVDLASGGDHAVSAGNGLQVSPDGKLAVFMKSGSPVLVEVAAMRSGLDPDESAALQPLFESRGNVQGLAWAPGSERLAFTSVRGDHSFIGVYDVVEQRISWIAPGVDFDSNPAWSPDGSQIAFFRTPGLRKDETRSVIESRRVSLMVADSKSGIAEPAWEAPVENGFFAQDYPQHPLRWSGAGSILFYSEHDGWVHIYAVNPDGTELVDLTPGECEAEHSALNANGTELVYSANCLVDGDPADTDRRHLWHRAINDGVSKPVTRGKKIESDPVFVGDSGLLAFRDAGTRHPPGISLIRRDGGQRDRIYPSRLADGYPSQQMVEPEQVQFRAADGVRVNGQLFRPAGAERANKAPALIFLHGGPIRQMLLGYHYYGEYYALTYAMNQYLANRGYVVLSVNFRSGIGYGRHFRLAEHQGPRGAAEYQDVVAAGRYLQSLGFVDAQRIGLWGGSYGGYLTAMGLARDSALFAAGVDLHGVHDWSWRGRDFGNDGWWSITDDLYPQALRSSPVADVEDWTSPVLFIHGDDDRNVMFGQTVDLVQRLREQGTHNEVLVFPDEVHSFLRHENWQRAFDATEEFFERHLGND